MDVVFSPMEVGDDVFVLFERGIVSLTENTGTHFTPSPTGNDHYQKPGSVAWRDEMLEKIRNYTKMK